MLHGEKDAENSEQTAKEAFSENSLGLITFHQSKDKKKFEHY